MKPEERGALAGWEATPQQRFERLLREKQIPIGIQIADEELRLIHAPRGETSGWLTFPLRSLAEVGGRPMLGGLKLLLSSFRLHNDAPETAAAGAAQGEPRGSGRGLHPARGASAGRAARAPARPACRRPRADRELAHDAPEHLYDGLLVVLLRLVFLLYAEDRDLIPSRTDAEARAFYAQGYGVRSLYAQLLDDRARHPDTMDERRGAWARLLAVFSLLHHGDSNGNWIRGRGGRLFDPAVYPFLQGQEKPGEAPAPAPVSDGCILRILDALITVDGEKLSYRTLDVEQIGSVYETVMGFTIETRAGPARRDQGRQERPHAGLRRPRGAGGGEGNGAGEVPQGGGRSQRAVRQGRQGARGGEGFGRRDWRPCGRLWTSAVRRAVMSRRPERRCCSRPTSAAAPAVITRRVR